MATYTLEDVAGDAPTGKKTFTLSDVTGASRPKMDAVEPPNWFERQLAKMPNILNPEAESAARGFAMGAADPSIGTIQTLANMLPGNIGSTVNQGIKAKEQQYQQGREGSGRGGFDAMRMTGNVASPVNLVLASRLPSATTTAGRAGLGALAGGIGGAMSPITDGGQDFAQDKLAQVGMGATVGGIAGPAFGAIADRFTPTLSSLTRGQPAPLSARNQTLKDAIDAGFVVPPATVNPTVMNRTAESIGGKIATEQQASNMNAELAQTLTRRAIGLPEGSDITSDLTSALRKQAYQTGYEPVARVGTVATDSEYLNALNSLSKSQKSASGSFPSAVKDDITPMIEGLKVKQFDAGEALQMSQILRDEASALYRAGDATLGKAKKAASKAIEDQIERSLSSQGQNGAGMLKGFRDARALMAKTHTVEDAIREGTGQIDSNKFAGMLQRGKPLSGELELIAKFANAFPKANKPVQQIGSPGVSKLAAATSAGLGMGGAAMGGPLGVAAGALPFVAPPLARAGLLSSSVQKGLIQQPRITPDEARLISQYLSGGAAIGGGGAGLLATGQ